MRRKVKKIEKIQQRGKDVDVEGYVEWKENGQIYRAPRYIYEQRHPEEE